MKKLKLLILLLCPFLISAAPSRVYTYTTGDKIMASEVTANEDAIFNYLNAGVEVYSDGTILNADIGSAANIQCGKLNLQACAQAITTTGAITTSSGITSTGLVASVAIQGPFYSNDGTAGYTGTCAAAATLTVKNGLITGCP